MFSRIFIERPKLAIVISIVMVFAGILCVNRIPVAEYPEISPPALIIIATYPGASGDVIANTIGAPLEEEMAGLDNLQYMQSSSSNAGSYELQLTFVPDTDIDMAQVDTQNALKRVESKLPAEVISRGINIYERSSDMLGMYAFTLNDKAEIDLLALSNYLRTHVKDELIRIPGLSQVQIMGISNYAMRVWLDTTKMSAMGISSSEVAAAVSDQNISATAGSVGTEASSNLLQFKVNAVGRLDSADQFENIVVRTSADGRTVKLKDIARIELASEDYSLSASNNNKPAVAMIIYRNSDANAIKVVDDANKRLAELSKSFPQGVEYHMGYDPTEYIRISVEEIVETLILTLILVVAITYLFLQNWRATLVPA